MLKKNKTLAKLIAASFALNTLGYAAMPVVAMAMSVASTPPPPVLLIPDGYDTINLDEEDDEKFINSVISIYVDATGPDYDAREAYTETLEGAKEFLSKVDNDPEGQQAAERVLAINERVENIAKKSSESGLIGTRSLSPDSIEQAKTAYSKAVDDYHACVDEIENYNKELEAEADDPKAPLFGIKNSAEICKLSPEAREAAKTILISDIQQFNITSQSPKTTNAVEKKGASTVGNPDDILWVQETDEKGEEFWRPTCTDPQAELNSDGKCVKQSEGIKWDTGRDEKGIFRIPTCEDPSMEVADGKCVARPEGAEWSMICDEPEHVLNAAGQCVKIVRINPTGYYAGAVEVIKWDTGRDEKGEFRIPTFEDFSMKVDDGKCVAKIKPSEGAELGMICDEPEHTVNSVGQCVKIERMSPPGYYAGAEEENIPTKKEDTIPKLEKSDVCPKDYVESNGNCCPSSSPYYDEASKACIVKKDPPVAYNPYQGNGKKEGEKGKQLLTSIGTVGLLAALLSSHSHKNKSDDAQNQMKDNGIQFAFNYLLGKDKKDVYLFPSSSDKKILFKLLRYHIPELANSQKGTKKPKITVRVPMPMTKGNGEAPTLQTAIIPIDLNQEQEFFPSTLGNQKDYYKPLAQFGEVFRTSASNFNKDYYQMVVRIDDGIHVQEHVIKFDFVSMESKMYVPNEDNQLNKSIDTILGSIPTISADGKIEGAAWDEKNQLCQITFSGTLTDTDVVTGGQDNTGEGQVSDFYSRRYNESECQNINNNKGADLHIDQLKRADDGKGRAILVDDDATNASTSTASNQGTANREQDANGNSTGYSNDDNDNYMPVTISPKGTAGNSYSWTGESYSCSVDKCVDKDGNPLTIAQQQAIAKDIYEKTKNPDYLNAERVSVCPPSNDLNNLGMMCIYWKDTTQKPEMISGKGFSANDGISLGNNVEAALLEKSSVTQGMSGMVTDWIGRVTSAITGKESAQQVTISQISGESTNPKAGNDGNVMGEFSGVSLNNLGRIVKRDTGVLEFYKRGLDNPSQIVKFKK